ncbi:MAG: ATP-binding protein [Kiritimatiellae bacterium]|nr:ATP-binding protein [Kiritimatiellia bacterium]
MKQRNPFVIYGYEGPKNFCDREVETEKLNAAIENGRNVTLLSERRIGKTGLIKHFFERLRKDGQRTTVYVDIFATASLFELTSQFASAVIGSMDSRLDKAILAATRFFKSFRPEISVDAVTGTPSFSIGLQRHHVKATLKECFEYLEGRGECVVAIDEFQQIGTYAESGTEALLRSYIQFLPKTRFIFAGSRHHMMTEMFSSAKRPFYNSTQTIPLDRIDRDVYYGFAAKRMPRTSGFTRKTFDQIYSMFDGITWYIQAMLNRLFERESALDGDVNAVVDELLQEKSWEYAALLKTLPSGSVRLLKAVAHEGKARAVTSGKFITSHSLQGASSVQIALKRLLEDEFLYETEDGYVVYDRLFGLWLARLP